MKLTPTTLLSMVHHSHLAEANMANAESLTWAEFCENADGLDNNTIAAELETTGFAEINLGAGGCCRVEVSQSA